jgi:hypothetical protein
LHNGLSGQSLLVLAAQQLYTSLARMQGAVVDICAHLDREAPGSHERKKAKSKLTPDQDDIEYLVCFMGPSLNVNHS